jgi:hypothetical protein
MNSHKIPVARSGCSSISTSYSTSCNVNKSSQALQSEASVRVSLVLLLYTSEISILFRGWIIRGRRHTATNLSLLLSLRVFFLCVKYNAHEAYIGSEELKCLHVSGWSVLGQSVMWLQTNWTSWFRFRKFIIIIIANWYWYIKQLNYIDICVYDCRNI